MAHKGIYKDNNGRWYIHTSINGKTCTIRGFKSKAEADEKYDNEIEAWKRKHNISSSSQYSNVVDEYIAYRSKIVRKESLRKDITQFKYYSAIFQNNSLNSVFDDFRIKLIYNDIISNKDFSSQKKMRLILAFRDFSKFCYLSQYINQDTHNKVLMTFIPVKENKQDRKTKRYIPQSDFKALYSVIIKDNDKLFALAIFVLYSCGLRVSELLGLIGSDVDLNKRIIKVQRQLLTNGDLTTTLKTSNSYRQVPINSELLDLFKNLELTGNRVFPYSHTTFKRKLLICEKNAQIDDFSCHEFRHTFCTNLAQKCSNIADVTYCASVSGHSVSMFLNTYCKSLDNELVNKFF